MEIFLPLALMVVLGVLATYPTSYDPGPEADAERPTVPANHDGAE